MYYLVSLSGLPPTITYKQVIVFIKDVKQHKIGYWIRLNKKSTDMRKILIEVYSQRDAEKLITLLNGKSYVTNDNITYECRAFVESKCEANTTQNPFRKSMQKKEGASKKNQTKNKDQEFLPEKLNNNAASKKSTKPLTLPKFHNSMRLIMDEMDSLINNNCSNQLALCRKTLRVRIRTRLTELFEGKQLVDVYGMSTPAIVATYRKAYNKSTDELFIKQTYNMVQVACWPGAETVTDGIYLEEMEVQDEGVINIDSCENSGTKMDVLDQDKGPIRDEEDWSAASWSDGGDDETRKAEIVAAEE